MSEFVCAGAMLHNSAATPADVRAGHGGAAQFLVVLRPHRDTRGLTQQCGKRGPEFCRGRSHGNVDVRRVPQRAIQHAWHIVENDGPDATPGLTVTRLVDKQKCAPLDQADLAGHVRTGAAGEAAVREHATGIADGRTGERVC